jgi:HD-GYP domain-containing protein (c-di-GMP phosphodiesterase class II)
MKISYRYDLEKTARQMILIHRADTLIKLILRTIIKSVKVRHAGVFIYDNSRDEYVVKVSRGHSGFKVPVGFVKIKKDSPLIRYFTDAKLSFSKEALSLDQIKRLRAKFGKTPLKKTIEELYFNLSFYKAKLCIPAFFRNDLIGIFFLGDKKNGRAFNRNEIGFLSVLASDAVMALKNAGLIEELNNQLAINNRMFLQTVSALASSIEAKDRYTSGHTERVTEFSLVIAGRINKHRKIKDWAKFIKDLRIAALLHDIGKIGVPEAILNKPAALTPEERAIIEKHPLIGVNILNHIAEFSNVLAGVKHHHERYNGGGYPSQLKGKQIPLIASIIALADAYDAMTTDRPYRSALSREAAIKEIQENRGRQFAPSVADAFLEAYGQIDKEKEKENGRVMASVS